VVAASLQEEQDKLQKLQSEASSSTGADLDKLQEEYRRIDEELQTMQRQKNQATVQQVRLRQELDTMAIRDEALQKEKNTLRIKAASHQNLMDEQLDNARINQVVELDDEMENSPAVMLASMADYLKGKLSGKTQGIDQLPETLDGMKDLEAEYAKRVKELERMEEQFNQCVALIPETDEGVIRLTEEIQKLKERLDDTGKDYKAEKEQFDKVTAERRSMFLDFFDRVSQRLPQIYRELTKSAGTANMLIADRFESPFESQIIFDFAPPAKRHGVDLEMLSGGEKTIAALSFVFALAQVKQPSLLVMDEVDCFLDPENVALVSQFLTEKLNPPEEGNVGQTQVLLVSHKEDLASQMSSLVGVCSLKQLGTSKAYALNLQEYAI
jgi:chromosome segregation ATPase